MPSEGGGQATAIASRRGGLIVFAAALGLTAGMGSTIAFSLGTFIPYLTAAQGWQRGDISLALTVLTVGIFLAGPFAGRLSDRYGAGSVGSFSLVAYALLVVVMALTVRSIELFWAFHLVIALVGAGSTPIVLLRPIAANFRENRGLALGMALAGAGLAGFWLPITVEAAASRFGWQAGYFAIAATALVAAPIVWFGFRGADRTQAASVARGPEAGLSLGEARRTMRFWMLSLAGVAMAMGVGGLVIHLVPILIDLEMTPAAAAGTAAIIGLASVVGRLLVGFMLDRLPPGLVAAGVMTASATGALALWQFGAPAAPVSAALLGLAAGAEVDLIAFFTARYFGQRAYGGIYGWQYSVFAMGYGLSPFIVGRLRDVRGDYDLAIVLCVGAMMLALVTVQMLSRRSGKGEQFARTLATERC